MFVPERTHVHVVSHSRLKWALQATRRQLERRAAVGGFDLEIAGAVSGGVLDRRHAAVLAASLRAWRVGGSFTRVGRIAKLDKELSPVEYLLDELERSRTCGLVAPEGTSEEDLGGFLGFAGSEVVPAAAVAISLLSGPSGRRRLSAGRSWVHRLRYLAQRRELAADDDLWSNWEAFASALRYACRMNRGIALETRGEMFVCYRNEFGNQP